VEPVTKAVLPMSVRSDIFENSMHYDEKPIDIMRFCGLYET
jgi:hypothetical protein